MITDVLPQKTSNKRKYTPSLKILSEHNHLHDPENFFCRTRVKLKVDIVKQICSLTFLMFNQSKTKNAV